MNTEQAKKFDEYQRIRLIRWYNLSLKPAVEKRREAGQISAYVANKLLEPYSHLSRKRIPTVGDFRAIYR